MTLPRRIAVSSIAIISLSAFFFLRGSYDNPPVIEREELLMGTIVQIKVSVGVNGNAKKVGEAIDRAFAEIARVESIFSVYDPASEISRINRLEKSETLKISAEAFYLIDKAMEYSVKTDGAFDITVKPLIDIWARAKAHGIVPSDEYIKYAMEKVDPSSVLLDRAGLTISFEKDGMALDLGGVAKGYAVDRAIETLKDNGIKDAIVNSGGDMYCLGARSKRQLWSVGIRHPRDSGSIFLELELRNKAIDTSGDYEKYYILDGKRYSHIIDPRSGRPIGDKVVSASVIADDAMTADILATTLCILGRDGLSIISKIGGSDAVVISKEDNGFITGMTAGFMERYSVKEKSKL